MKVAAPLFVVLVAMAQQSSGPRVPANLETLSVQMQKFEQKIDSLTSQVQDLNTKMNLVLVVGSIIFGAMITQIAGALNKRAVSVPSGSAVLESLSKEARDFEDVRVENADLRARFNAAREISDREREWREKDAQAHRELMDQQMKLKANLLNGLRETEKGLPLAPETNPALTTGSGVKS
jgi:hypothetical protein